MAKDPPPHLNLVDDSLRRFAVFERRTSFRENGPRGGPWTAKQLAQLVVEDGTVAVPEALQPYLGGVSVLESEA